MQSAAILLSRAPRRDAPTLSFLGDGISLAQGRLHEVCGPARWSFAAWLAGAIQATQQGPVLWMSRSWQTAQINPEGLATFCAPDRILFAPIDKMDDMFWCMEEALRSGRIPLVVADVAELPGLTQIRRLHLACEQGGKGLSNPPLALLITPDDGGAPGVETRWHLAAEVSGWTLTRLRARTAPQAHFAVMLGQKGPMVDHNERAAPAQG